jgi:hypothetical protein
VTWDELQIASQSRNRVTLLFGLRERATATRGREMKAAIVPSANSNWEVKETKIPEPSENQVLIKIRASVLHRRASDARGVAR